MKIKTVQRWALAVLGVFLAFAFFWIAFKIFKSSAKVEEKVVKVTSIKAAVKEINETVDVQGVAEGDPQVKIYPMVPGKFEKPAVKEGASVKKDDVILYINRDIVGMDFQLAPIKSPISGIVTKIYYSDRGASVSPQNPVAEVSNPSNIKVVLNVGEEDMVKVKAGMESEIKPVYGNGSPIKASVYSSTPFIDRDTMAGTIIVRGANVGNALQPGMSVNVSISIGKRNSIMLPESAVLMGDGKTYVFINDNGKAKRVDFEPGYMANDEIEVKSGLAEGAEVLTEGNFKLNEGTRVDTK
jgi:multidrug efflux pump subunit AcrA (membrane-fusion protein)